MVLYILGYFLCIYIVCVWYRFFIMVGMIEFGDLVIGNINYVNVIRYEFGCICGVVDNLIFFGVYLIYDVLWNCD